MNLLKETIEVLTKNNKTEQDVLWVGNKTHKTVWGSFKIVADIEYDKFDWAESVATDLLVVGVDWWLERFDNDITGGRWIFKTLPTEPYNIINIKAITPKQAIQLGIKCEEWDDELLTINGID